MDKVTDQYGFTNGTTGLAPVSNPGFDCASFFSMHRIPFTLTPKKENIYTHYNFTHVKNTLLFSISSGEKIVKITGDVGSGKTLLINHVLSSIDHQHYPIRILNPKISPKDLLCQIIDEFGLPYPADATIEQLMRMLRYTLHEHYTKTDTNILVWIDDAHLLSRNTLITIDKISSWSTPSRTLLPFIISGNEKLNEKINQPLLTSLKNNIRFSDKLKNIEKSEISAYLNACIQPKDKLDKPQFTPKAINALYKHSNGNPSVINALAYKALLLAYGKGYRTITHHYIHDAFQEHNTDAPKKKSKWLIAGISWACINIAIGIAFAGGYL